MKKVILALITVFLTFHLQAGEIQEKYNKLDNEKKHGVISEEVRKKTLEDNLTVAVKLSLLRYYKYCNYADVVIGDGQYERSKIHKFMYYVQYKEFTGYVIYEHDPEVYRVLPVDENFYVDPGTDVLRIGDASCKSSAKNIQ